MFRWNCSVVEITVVMVTAFSVRAKRVTLPVNTNRKTIVYARSFNTVAVFFFRAGS